MTWPELSYPPATLIASNFPTEADMPAKLPECQTCPLLLAILPIAITRSPCVRDWCAALWASAFLPSDIHPPC